VYTVKDSRDFPDNTGIIAVHQTEDYWEGAYPHLFPFGRRGPNPRQ
jgi:hypothetical protein